MSKNPRIVLPDIETIVYRQSTADEELPMVRRTSPTSPIPATTDVGIHLDIGLLTTTPIRRTTSAVGKYIPRTPQETADVLHLITSEKSSHRSQNFNQKELSQIARNLNIQSSGCKSTLVKRITDHIKNFFDT